MAKVPTAGTELGVIINAASEALPPETLPNLFAPRGNLWHGARKGNITYKPIAPQGASNPAQRVAPAHSRR